MKRSEAVKLIRSTGIRPDFARRLTDQLPMEMDGPPAFTVEVPADFSGPIFGAVDPENPLPPLFTQAAKE